MRPIPAISTDHQEIVFVQTETLFAQWINAVASAATVLIMLAVYWPSNIRGAVAVWAGAVIVHVAVWLTLTVKWRNLPDQRAVAHTWRDAYLSMMIINGLLWGAGAVLTIPNGSADQSVFATVMVVGAVAMTFPYSIHYPAFLAFEIPTTIGGGLGFAMNGTSTGWIIGIMSLILCAGLAELGRQLGVRLLAASRLAIENAELVATLKDNAAEIERANEELRRVSMLDPLTGLANRRRFVETLRSEGRKPGATLLYIDVDHFKQYNDSYGHGSGDECLIAVARVLTRYAEMYGGHAARQGGEEFSLLLAEMSTDTAGMIAETLRLEIQDLHSGGARIARPVTVSIGYAHRVPQMNDDQFMDQADAAAYRAKRAGRNRVCGPDDSGEATKFRAAIA